MQSKKPKKRAQAETTPARANGGKGAAGQRGKRQAPTAREAQPAPSDDAEYQRSRERQRELATLLDGVRTHLPPDLHARAAAFVDPNVRLFDWQHDELRSLLGGDGKRLALELSALVERWRMLPSEPGADAWGADVLASIVDAAESPEGQRRLCEWQLEEQRAELDPQEDLSLMLDRIEVLVARAAALNAKDPDNALTPGLALLGHVAGELRLMLPPFKGAAYWEQAVRIRHASALEDVRAAKLLLEAERAVSIAAIIHAKPTGQGQDADAEATRRVRERLGRLLPRKSSDKEILCAVLEYRKPRARSGRRSNDGGEVSTDESRARALVEMLRLPGYSGNKLKGEDGGLMTGKSAARMLREQRAEWKRLRE